MTTSTRERLLDATWALLRDEGVVAATSRRITSAAGANLAAITYHFGSKDDLVGQAVAQQLRTWTAPLTSALTRETTDIAEHDIQVASAVVEMLSRLAADTGDVNAIVALVLARPDTPGVRDAIVGWMTELRAVASAVMARQQAAGFIPPSVTPSIMAAVFTAFALGLAAQASLDPDAPATASVVGEFLGLLVRPNG